MAESVLPPEEKPLRSDKCKLKIWHDDRGTLVTLFLTEISFDDSRIKPMHTLRFVKSSGTFRKQYDLHWLIQINSITNVRIESGVSGSGKQLVIEQPVESELREIRCEDLSDPESWRTIILELIEQDKNNSRR